jgi:hypothetical protein
VDCGSKRCRCGKQQVKNEASRYFHDDSFERWATGVHKAKHLTFKTVNALLCPAKLSRIFRGKKHLQGEQSHAMRPVKSHIAHQERPSLQNVGTCFFHPNPSE